MTTLTPPLSDEQRAIVALWYEVNASLSAYHKLITAFGSAGQAWAASAGTWQQRRIHRSHIVRHEQHQQTVDAVTAIEQALAAGKYQLVFAEDARFPQQLLNIYDPPPLLFYHGDIERLQHVQIAMVGSRNPTAHAQKTTFDMAQYLAQIGYVITSGLAMGVDKRAHLGALSQTDPECQGRTIGVMGTGINVCYPNHHDALFAHIIEQGGCIISELLPDTPPNQHNFPRRNRLVAGLSLATIVTEAAVKSGSLITARLTSEQGKQVFAVPSHIDNHNAEGCHHLIREGATLIYHPQQVADDVGLQLIRPVVGMDTSQTLSDSIEASKTAATYDPAPSALPQATSAPKAISSPSTTVPEHLSGVYGQLDWHGQDLDALLLTLSVAPPQLIGQLMELELLGLIKEQGGRYARL